MARTVVIPDPGPLERFVGGLGDMVFLNGADGLVGIGELTRFETDSLDAADVWWTEFCTDLEHETEVFGVPGSGPIAFGTFTFDPETSTERSALVVPRVVIGRRGDVCWLTRLGLGDLRGADVLPDLPAAPRPPGQTSWSDAALSGPAFETAVAEAVRQINAGALDKVVLAHSMVATAERAIEPGWVIRRLRHDYPGTWTYLVDGMVGATPELLVQRDHGLITSRVLAGTIRRETGESDELPTLSARLITSDKNRREHAYAAASVAETMGPFVTAINVPPAPYVLELPNVLHLATDVTAVAEHLVSALALAQALHPTSAVCGTPRETARLLIAELEGNDRGRYAGPIGWIDANGDGQWAVALRGGQISRAEPREIQVFAGCGIVADSDPEDELLESVAKMIPMRDALS